MTPMFTDAANILRRLIKMPCSQCGDENVEGDVLPSADMTFSITVTRMCRACDNVFRKKYEEAELRTIMEKLGERGSGAELIRQMVNPEKEKKVVVNKALLRRIASAPCDACGSEKVEASWKPKGLAVHVKRKCNSCGDEFEYTFNERELRQLEREVASRDQRPNSIGPNQKAIAEREAYKRKRVQEAASREAWRPRTSRPMRGDQFDGVVIDEAAGSASIAKDIPARGSSRSELQSKMLGDIWDEVQEEMDVPNGDADKFDVKDPAEFMKERTSMTVVQRRELDDLQGDAYPFTGLPQAQLGNGPSTKPKPAEVYKPGKRKIVL